MELVIVTGLSGAGKSCVMNALEDTGYFCMDNLPVKLIPVFAKLLKETGEHKKIAVVTDVRAGLTAEGLTETLTVLDELTIPYRILFLDCSDDVLLSRYKQTRRIHPLMNGNSDTLGGAIDAEKNLLMPVRDISHFVLNTTDLSLSDCKTRIFSVFSDNAQNQMHIHCMSFGFKHGLPKDADFVFDVRFLPNPFYIPELKELTGLDKRVSDYVMESKESKELEKRLTDLISDIIPMCLKEGRSQLIIAVGCTGGHHRSVTFAERLCNYLKSTHYNVSVSHRDIKK